MDYALCRLILGESASVKITMAEHSAIRSARDGLNGIVAVEEKFSLVMENYAELEQTLLTEGVRHLVFIQLDFTNLQELRNLISRRLLNLLAATRLYLDSLPRHAASLLGGDDPATTQIKTEPARLYDQSLSYRVMEALRNFAQHRELPIHAIMIGNEWENAPSGNRMACSVVPSLDIEMLAGDAQFKSSVLQELRRMDRRIDVMPFAREYIERLGDIHAKFRGETNAREREWEAVIVTAMNRFKDAFPEVDLIGLAAVTMEDEILQGEPIQLFQQSIDYRQYLQQRTGTMANLSKRYVKW
jgi:hypothetical protein